jgi:hypothetical protein
MPALTRGKPLGHSSRLRERVRRESTPIADELRRSLREHGVSHPEVVFDLDAPLHRVPTGKLERYVPLGFEGLQHKVDARS